MWQEVGNTRQRKARRGSQVSKIPTIYDRVCQQVLLNRLEPIFELIFFFFFFFFFYEANFGYRRGRSTQDAMRKVWKEIQSGREWIVDADLKDFFRVCCTLERVNAGCLVNSRWSSVASDRGDAEGRKLWQKGATLSHRARDPAGRGEVHLFEVTRTPDAV